MSVESIRTVDINRADPNLAALAVGAAMAECPKEDRLDVLCTGLMRIVEADWVAALGADGPVLQLGEAPDLAWLTAFLAGSQHLDEVVDAAPSDLVWANLLSVGLNVVAGRNGRPIHERERIRVNLLGRLAEALL